MIERYSHDVSTGEAYARGVTESESAQVQALEAHYDKMSETAGLTKEQTAALTGQAKVGGGWDFIVKVGAVKLPPARRSGSVARVTGACVCDGGCVKWPAAGCGDRPHTGVL